MRGKDIHGHQCPKQGCGKVWSHDGEKLRVNCTEDELKKEHSCPDCGTVQWWKQGTGPYSLALSRGDYKCEMPGMWQGEDQHALPPMPRGLASLFQFLTERDQDDSDEPGDRGDGL